MNISKNWLHIGAGSFHRAHQAWYLNELRRFGDFSWHLMLGNIREDQLDIQKALLAQQGIYTLETIKPDGGKNYERIESIREVILWEPGLNNLISRGSDIETKIISFTVTEAGYYLDKDENIIADNPDILSDFYGDRRTIYGVISSILENRRIKKSGSVTLLCCDNLRHNGQRFYHGLCQYLKASGQLDLLKWVASHIACPNTMVDRITPQPSSESILRVKEYMGIDDEIPVTAESFIQWVIEDKFISDRPPLEKIGVDLVSDVIPFEEAKIRILNASHSCIAWAGTLEGKKYIHESISENTIRDLVHNFITFDVIPNLMPHPLDLEGYRDIVIERFTNPYIQDTNQRVSTDGFSKMVEFILPTISDSLNCGYLPQFGIKIVSLYYNFLKIWFDGRLPYEYKDSVLDREEVKKIFESTDPVSTFVSSEIFFGKLIGNSLFVSSLNNEIRGKDC
ncbi:mannitol dehydrogenase family protein (plasmid) [Klebsiella michiganensis]|uniref:D-arabinitol 4-dehydrogenase n=1 Tax=Klebsiella michiganensis TaxID=1134687 RepID=UPI0021DAA419|nr:D-arabinitol 4-dehydrogenase [Klebsiella michiganensis]UYB60133.1 mannitol dehydrogenase family protein [Klebsiella michiganensis]